MRIRLPGKKQRWVHVSFTIMCILAILTAIIVCVFGLPASAEFPLALIAVGAYAVHEWHKQHHKEQK